MQRLKGGINKPILAKTCAEETPEHKLRVLYIAKTEPAHTLMAKSVHNFYVHWKLDTRIIRPRGNFSTEPQKQIMQFVHYTDRI